MRYFKCKVRQYSTGAVGILDGFTLLVNLAVAAGLVGVAVTVVGRRTA